MTRDIVSELQARIAFLEAALADAESRASRDGLTGLLNRSEFDRNVAIEWERAKRENQQLSLLFVDLDNLKLMNQSLGHLAVNDCLAVVGEILSRHCRRITDTCYRFGGDEFCVLLPNTDAVAAYDIAEMIRLSVLQQLKISVTIGLSCVAPSRQGQGWRDLVEVSNKGLLHGKMLGKNMVCSFAIEQVASVR